MPRVKKRPAPHQRADKTREKILKAAKHLFARNGFAGTSTIKVAERADVPNSLVFHHFSNKANLWLAVKAYIVEQDNQDSELLPSTELPLETFLKLLIERLFTFYHKDSDLLRMLSWQRMENYQKMGIDGALSEESLRWIAAFAQYQKKGEICQEIKPEYIITMIGALISAAAYDPNAIPQEADAMQQYLDFCCDRLLVMMKTPLAPG
ncbi:TetR/AcrR family transcriptional regulator [Dongshaea marina]|uniref:TetR/AcrR family transcriptional regulator n=1 Tax=Dongshaea marina TaxID=2047966 RepID=UPI000D3EB365|nr:TetR/AcrR family transcriptional regulator [Dongshaea marina]